MHITSKTIKIAFDNGGGVTLFNRHYAHNYDDGQQLAADVICLLAGSNVRQWDGNDEELRLTMQGEDLSRYDAVYGLTEIASILADAAVLVSGNEVSLRGYGHRVSGHTESRFFRAVSAR